MTYRWRSAAATLVVALSAAAAAAQVVPATVTLLFPRAMQIPGQTLDSGAYTFRIEPARGELEFVHIAPADGSARPVRVLAIGRERPPVYGETYHTYGPNPVDAVALRAWFNPGSLFEHVFIYPTEQASRIAAAGGEPVLSAPHDPLHPEAITLADLHWVDAAGRRHEFTAYPLSRR